MLGWAIAQAEDPASTAPPACHAVCLSSCLPAAARAESVALRSELASVQSELSNANNKLAAEQGDSECCCCCRRCLCRRRRRYMCPLECACFSPLMESIHWRSSSEHHTLLHSFRLSTFAVVNALLPRCCRGGAAGRGGCASQAVQRGGGQAGGGAERGGADQVSAMLAPPAVLAGTALASAGGCCGGPSHTLAGTALLALSLGQTRLPTPLVGLNSSCCPAFIPRAFLAFFPAPLPAGATLLS